MYFTQNVRPCIPYSGSTPTFLFLHSIFVILFSCCFFSFLFCLCSLCISINFSILFQTLYISVPKERLQAGIGWSGCWHVCNLSVNALGYRSGVVEYELLLWMLKVNVNLTMDSKIQVIYYSKILLSMV